jgi:hypothetical protein
MSLPDLAAVLWRQRELLERLAYKLECERLLMTSGRTRWLATATSEVELLTDELAVIEIQRGAVADGVCRELGIDVGASLEELAVAASPPWTAMLLDHRDALIALTTELASLAETTRQITTTGLAAVEATLASVGLRDGATSRGYDAKGRTDVIAGHTRSAMIDRAL